MNINDIYITYIIRQDVNFMCYIDYRLVWAPRYYSYVKSCYVELIWGNVLYFLSFLNYQIFKSQGINSDHLNLAILE